MFDLFESLLTGDRFEYDGKKYILLKLVKDGLALAVEEESEMPAPVVLVRYSEAPQKGQDLNG